MNSCAAWLSWKCQMSSGTAREHVRVARALRDLPVIRGEFGAGRLSYAKVRALTRIATPDNEAGLAEIAGPMTGNQLERFARAHRQVSSADDAARGSSAGWPGALRTTGRFPVPSSCRRSGAVLLKALRAAVGDLEHPHVSAETPDRRASRPLQRRPRPAGAPTSSSLADALLAIAEAFLAEKAAAADDPDLYQVIVHVGADVITARRDPAAPGSPPVRGRPAGRAGRPAPGDPAHPARCHVEDGPAISVTTAQMIACGSTWSWMLHDSAGRAARRGPTAPPPDRRAAPCGPGTGQVPVPIPWL